ncbi:MAG: hypothetical protein OEN55_08845 [Alphaproteobacteria bacterium]|nr:hypothetical protein [Alphaproteobacteria bacterium]
MPTDLIKKFLIAAVFMGVLSGCSVSPAVDAASWTVDGISYLLTGKGTMDHAVSAAAGQDCAMMRVIKNQRICVPRDEDVAGDRLVFKFENPSAAGTAMDQVANGDPLRVDPAIADIVQPLGGTVLVQTRSTAIAAVAADAMPIRAMAAGQETDGWTSVLSGLIKDKPAMPMTSPDRATRLWLPVE